MNAAIVQAFDRPPVYGEVAPPTPGPGEVAVTVLAAAVSELVKGIASGRHYSAPKAPGFVPGVDGVGRLADGRRVYFVFPRTGALAERSVVAEAQCVPLPDDLDDVTAAALANPGMSSWAALTRRVRLVRGETVLINGATGTSGQLAVQIAKHLGAGRVIATGRNPEALARLPELGADAVISLEQDDLAASFREALVGVDVVLDYLWGPSAEALIRATGAIADHAGAARVRFVQIGSVGGADITLPAAVLRSSGLELLGSGLGSVSRPELVAVIGELLAAARPADLRIATRAVPLAEVESVWEGGDRRRLVLQP